MSTEQIGNLSYVEGNVMDKLDSKTGMLCASLFHRLIRGFQDAEGAAISITHSALLAIQNTCNVGLEWKEFHLIRPILISGVKRKKQPYIVPGFPCSYAAYSLKNR